MHGFPFLPSLFQFSKLIDKNEIDSNSWFISNIKSYRDIHSIKYGRVAMEYHGLELKTHCKYLRNRMSDNQRHGAARHLLNGEDG
jgi:hypothetical protein